MFLILVKFFVLIDHSNASKHL